VNPNGASEGRRSRSPDSLCGSGGEAGGCNGRLRTLGRESAPAGGLGGAGGVWARTTDAGSVTRQARTRLRTKPQAALWPDLSRHLMRPAPAKPNCPLALEARHNETTAQCVYRVARLVVLRMGTELAIRQAAQTVQTWRKHVASIAVLPVWRGARWKTRLPFLLSHVPFAHNLRISAPDLADGNDNMDEQDDT